MGIKIQVGGQTLPIIDYSVEEAATPLAGGDTTGQVGTFTLSASLPNDSSILLYNNPQLMSGKDVVITDESKGFTLGTVESTSYNKESGILNLTGVSRLGKLNIYGVQALPFIGRLDDAMEYYASLAGVTTDVFTDAAIASMQVVAPGWYGELWDNLKMFAAANDFDISLVSGVILARPIRVRQVNKGRMISGVLDLDSSNRAQRVEVYQYNSTAITNALVYPPGGWNADVDVITLSAGETIEETLEISASLSSVIQPQFMPNVGKNDVSASVYTVCGDDGLPITKAAWENKGGSLKVEIGQDTKSIIVKITAPTGIPNKDGTEIKSYGISVASEDGTGRYSTLRILGSGVAFNKELISIPTGLTDASVGTDVGITIDSPFVQSTEQAYRVGVRAAARHAGNVQTISGTLYSINKLGDSGIATYPTYAYVESELAGKTYSQVEDMYINMSYQQVEDAYFAEVRNDFANQVFGNVAGARIWDTQTRRWYRIRSAGISGQPISFQADDDLTYEDVEDFYADLTYAEVEAIFSGLNYSEAALMGLYK